MRRATLCTMCACVALAASAASAQALPTFWEVKATASGPFEKLTIGVKETLLTSGKLVYGGMSGGKGIKGAGCVLNDTEVIENEAFGEGIDEMTSFEAVCKPTAPAPCVASEAWRLRGLKLPWFSELVIGVEDVFTGVEVEVECASGAKGFYKPPGGVWHPKLSLNALKSTSASGVFKKSPGNNFYLVGTDKLKPVSAFEVQ